MYDKRQAKKSKSRISEFYLHLLESVGGILTIFPLIFIIRHKNKKKSYLILSFLWVMLWGIMLYNSFHK
ncbi:MAG: DUF1294 domain-containing protein [Bacteroidales bacterium]|jgi:uncharacterized membrane protein YsdA (DUF1294 family)|nr:DUF1294 domain-containing protein [Bacteroidales bacterium]